MIKERIEFEASAGGGNRIAAFFCPSEGKARGVIQICHGMADHFERYDEMTEYLNKEGFHVCGMDMMGHGQTYVLNRKMTCRSDISVMPKIPRCVSLRTR